MIKKKYLIPTIDVVIMDSVSMIATSPSFDLKDEEDENDPGKMTNKRQNDFMNHTWE
jgi:hypothetical protein